MEVYDVTGEREMLTLEKAKVIADTIIANASTLKRVVLGTKTYKADAARIVAGKLLRLTVMGRSPLASSQVGGTGSRGYDFGSVLRRGTGHLRGVRGLLEGSPPEVPGSQQQRAGSERSVLLQRAHFRTATPSRSP